jgi:hypothetical protein
MNLKVDYFVAAIKYAFHFVDYWRENHLVYISVCVYRAQLDKLDV